MSRPAGSKNKPKSVTVTNQDGYAQAFTGAGTSRDRSSYSRVKESYLMVEGDLNDFYIGDGFAKAIVDIPAEDMVRAGLDFEGMDEALEDKVKSRYEELNVMKHMADAVRWSRLYGGSVCVFGLNDGGTFDVPFNEAGLKSVEFIRVYNRYEATIKTRVTDVTSKDYGNAEVWQISPAAGSPYDVHNSRIKIFDGEAIPARMRQMNLGWGMSSLQACKDQLVRLGLGHQWANMLLERAQQAVHKIPNLSGILMAPEGEKNIRRRVDVVDMVRGVLNTVVVDAAEDYTVNSLGMGNGVNEFLDRLAEALSGVSRIPVFMLTGKSATGLNGSSSTNMDAWNAQVKAWQKDILHEPLDWLTRLLCQEVGSTDGGEYKLCFNPLYVPTAKEVAETKKIEQETKKSKMETETGYVAVGILDPNEVRDTLQEEYNISGDLTVPIDQLPTTVTVRA